MTLAQMPAAVSMGVSSRAVQNAMDVTTSGGMKHVSQYRKIAGNRGGNVAHT